MTVIPTIYPRIIFEKCFEFKLCDEETYIKALNGEVVTIELEGMKLECVMSLPLPHTQDTNNK